tara:strand:- start:645 stop:1343 length:699 start_codon:yes stop_codon:yes gene_type:complete
MKLSIIIPIFNEKKTIIKLLRVIEEQKFIKKQIIIVDDCSTDNSLDLVNSYDFKDEKLILSHKTNKGKGASIQSAQKYINGDYVIIQDADLEYDPNDYKILLEPLIKGNSDVVYGSRVLNKKRYKNNFISNYRILGNHLLTLFSNLVNKQNLSDAHTCYKIFKADLFKSVKLTHNDFSFCPEITTKISNLKKKIIEVPISYKGRSVEEGKKITLKDAFLAVYTLIKFKYFIN